MINPGRANLSYISLQNVRTVYVIEEKKLARLKGGHPTSSVDGPTFLHIKTLTPPARQRNNQSMGESVFFLVYRRYNINGSLGPDEVSLGPIFTV